MPRSQSYPIPLHDIPKGIQLCYENCKRLFDDAVLLEEQKRVSSSIANVILSQEEKRFKDLEDHQRKRCDFAIHKKEDTFNNIDNRIIICVFRLPHLFRKNYRFQSIISC